MMECLRDGTIRCGAASLAYKTYSTQDPLYEWEDSVEVAGDKFHYLAIVLDQHSLLPLIITTAKHSSC